MIARNKKLQRQQTNTMATFTKKMIRAECRKLFGAQWFECSAKLKQARKKLAQQTLIVEELTKLECNQEPVIESEPAQPLESPAKADPLPRRKGSAKSAPAPEPEIEEPAPELEPVSDSSDSSSDSDSDSSSDSDSDSSSDSEEEEEEEVFSPLGKTILIRQGKYKGLNAEVVDWNPDKEQIRFQIHNVKHRKCWNKWNEKKFNIIEA
jgi:type IV secretory pathway VirB10-like protein